MLNSLKSGNRLRVDFSKTKQEIEIPNLLQLQQSSYENFLKLGNVFNDYSIEKVFKSIFPIHIPNKVYLEYLGMEVTQPKYSVRESVERGLTYSISLKIKIRLTLGIKVITPIRIKLELSKFRNRIFIFEIFR